MDRTLHIANAPTLTAPDGLKVRPLLATDAGSMAEFRLAPHRVGQTIKHRTVSEVWQVVEGLGDVWLESIGITSLTVGACFSVPVGHAFQVRSGKAELVVIAMTTPPWPESNDEVILLDSGPWMPTL